MGAKFRRGNKAIVRLVNGVGGLHLVLSPILHVALVLIEQEDPFSSAPVVVLLNNTTYDGKNPYNDQVGTRFGRPTTMARSM